MSDSESNHSNSQQQNQSNKKSSDLQNDYDILSSALNKSEHLIVQKNQEIGDLKKRISQFDQKIGTQEDELNQLFIKNQELDTENQAHQQSLNALNEDKFIVDQEIQLYKVLNKQHLGDITQKDIENEQLKQENKNLMKEKGQLQFEYNLLEQKFQDQLQDYKNLSDEKDLIEYNFNESKQNFGLKYLDQEKQQQLLKQDVQQLEDENEKLHQKIQQNIQDFEIKLDEFNHETDIQLQGIFEQHNEQIDNLKKQIKDLEQHINIANNQVQEKNLQISAVNNDIGAKNMEIINLKQQLSQKDIDYQNQINELQDKYNNIQQKEDSAIQQIQLFQKQDESQINNQQLQDQLTEFQKLYFKEKNERICIEQQLQKQQQYIELKLKDFEMQHTKFLKIQQKLEQLEQSIQEKQQTNIEKSQQIIELNQDKQDLNQQIKESKYQQENLNSDIKEMARQIEYLVMVNQALKQESINLIDIQGHQQIYQVIKDRIINMNYDFKIQQYGQQQQQPQIYTYGDVEDLLKGFKILSQKYRELLQSQGRFQ